MKKLKNIIIVLVLSFCFMSCGPAVRHSRKTNNEQNKIVKSSSKSLEQEASQAKELVWGYISSGQYDKAIETIDGYTKTPVGKFIKPHLMEARRRAELSKLSVTKHRIKTYLQQGEYNEVIDIVDSYTETPDEELIKLHYQAKQLKLSDAKDRIKEYVEQGEYDKAIETVDAYSKTPEDEYIQLRNQVIKFKENSIYFTEHKDEVLSNLEVLIQKGNHDQATKMVNAYIGVEDKELLKLQRKVKELKLYREVKAVPGKELEKNRDMYAQLMKLNTDEPKYKEKYKYYNEKIILAEKKYQSASDYFNKKGHKYNEFLIAISAINKAISLQPNVDKYKELKYKLKNQELLFPQGNDKAQIAVRNLGRGLLYVWVKNVSSKVFHVNPNDFTLITKDNRSHRYSKSDGIMVDLQPETTTEGKISFDIYSEPRELVYSSFSVGRISRIFP